MMRVRVEIGTDVSEKEIVLRTNEYDEEVERMLSLLQKIQKTPQLIFIRIARNISFPRIKFCFLKQAKGKFTRIRKMMFLSLSTGFMNWKIF